MHLFPGTTQLTSRRAYWVVHANIGCRSSAITHHCDNVTTSCRLNNHRLPAISRSRKFTATWIHLNHVIQELSSCWDGRPFGHNRRGPKSGGCCALFWGAGSPSNIMWPRPRPTSIRSGVVIRLTVWPQYTNVTDRQDRQTTVRYRRSNRFTNGRPIIQPTSFSSGLITTTFCRPLV